MANVDITIRTIDETQRGVRGAKASFTEINQAIELMRKGVELAKQAYDFSKEGAAIERLGTASAEVFRQMGSDIDDAVVSIQDGALGAISEVDAMQAASRAAMLNVSADADQLGELMQIAAFRGRAMGVDTTQAFNDIVTGIGRASPLILDNLGIITKGWAEEAKAAGKAYDAQFILNKVLKQGGDQLALAGGLAEDTATSYERLEAQTKDYYNTLKVEAGKALEPTVKWLAEAVEEHNKYTDALDKSGLTQAEFMQAAMNAGMTLEEYTQFVIDGRNALFQIADAAESFDRSIMGLNTTMPEAEQDLEALAKQTEEWTKQTQEYFDNMGRMSDDYRTYNEKINDINKERAEIEAQMQADLALGWWEGSEKIQGYRDKLDELAEKENEYTDNFELNKDKRILAGVEEMLAKDGFTEGEIQYLEELGLARGVYTQEAIDNMRAERHEIEILAGAINSLPERRSIDIILNMSGDMAGLGGVGTLTEKQELRGFGFASGTGGWATVPPGYPNDSYPIGLSSGESFNVVPANQTQSGGGGIDEERLGRVIVDAMMKVIQ